jgi:hypothetical protein
VFSATDFHDNPPHIVVSHYIACSTTKNTLFHVKSSCCFILGVIYICNTCALSKHTGNMCMRLRNGGKGEASPSLFLRFAPNTHLSICFDSAHVLYLSCNFKSRRKTRYSTLGIEKTRPRYVVEKHAVPFVKLKIE